jgi:hypothetical protein
MEQANQSMTTAPDLKTLKFEREKFALSDSTGNSYSLAGVDLTKLRDPDFSFPWTTGADFALVELGDLPCRLETAALQSFMARLWSICAEGAQIKIQIPHPRHDIFIEDIGYVKALLPESFAQLDLKKSTTGIARQLGVNFEFVDAIANLDPHWQDAIDRKEVTLDDIALISIQACNVVQWNSIELKVRKSMWVEANPQAFLTSEMRQQLTDQMHAQMARGDVNAANVIKTFLEKGAQNGTV